MSASYFTKAVFAGLVTFLGAINVLLTDGSVLRDITQGQWVGVGLATIVVVGGVLGLQEAPKTIATSVRQVPQ